jgi:hypothetical protein
MAMPSTMIPMPPIHCVSERQNRMPVGQRLDVAEHGGAGGGEPGDGLEEGVERRLHDAGQQVRQRAGGAHGDPGERHDGVAFPDAEVAAEGSP